ncbi:MAG: hypothetical protein K2N51_11760 [Lachnospiraceae bacterium]|nr:hypothetical protein [Lachnospiraceae bacterium]
MKSLIIDTLYIFSPEEKKACRISFSKGINIISTRQEDGTDRGKSVIMRSIYYTLGAEVFFDKNFSKHTKVFVVKICINDNNYFIYRAGSLFKFFDDKKKLIFTTIKSRELAKKLVEYTGFAVQLPDRQENKLEITPPVFNYLLFFLDQDHYDCSKFTSFDKLGQYDKIKENILYYHLGVYDEEYYELVKRKEEIDSEIFSFKNRNALLEEMQNDIEERMEGGCISLDEESLHNEMQLKKEEYEEILMRLKKSKNNLLNLRNDLIDMETIFEQIESEEKNTNNNLKKLNKHICPECGSIIETTIRQRSKKLVLKEDLISVKNQLQIHIVEAKLSIEKEEEQYKILLKEMEDYQETMHINNKQIDDALRYKGFCEIRDSIIKELTENGGVIQKRELGLKEIKKEIKQYSQKKKNVNDHYKAWLSADVAKFGMNEIDMDKIKSVMNEFKASGSNKNIATVIWYLLLIRLRSKFNADAIKYPIVFDSLNNTETDDEKRDALIQYVLDKTKDEPQAIYTFIGFDKDKFNENGTLNIIELENEKYELLIHETYAEYSGLLDELCDAD